MAQARRGVRAGDRERVAHALGREAVAHGTEQRAVLVADRRRDLQQILAETVGALDPRLLEQHVAVGQAEAPPGVARGRRLGRDERAPRHRERLPLGAHVDSVDELRILLDGALEQPLHVEKGVVLREPAQRERVIASEHAAFARDAFLDVLLHRAEVLRRRLRAHHADGGERGKADDARDEEQRSDELLVQALPAADGRIFRGAIHGHSRM